MNKILLMSGIIASTAMVLGPLSPRAANASACSASSQTNDKSGPINVSHPVSSTGSCSTAVIGRAGQGSPHIRGVDAFNDPGFKTGTCSSASGSHAGFDTHFGDGQSSGDGSCSASSHSP